MNSVLVGVCGSVAAYKAATLVRDLRRDGAAVRVMMSAAAQKFVGAATFRALSGQAVATDEWDAPLCDNGMDHIGLSRAADALLIAPASADFLAKAAAGHADSLLTSAFLAAECPRFVAPAMNRQMWEAPATARNVRALCDDGAFVLPPAEGEQACGETGPGRMMEPEDIAARLRSHFSAPLAGRRVVVSTGATVEKIDDMRIISNVSSGRMGFCVAQAAAAAGAQVQIVAGRTFATAPLLPLRRALSSAEMRAAVLEECEHADMFVSAAAVCDFVPETAEGKIPRRNGGISLRLSASDDILSSVTRRYPEMFAVGFAAESGAPAARVKAARAKMRRKGASMFAVNPVSDAGGDSSELTLLSATGEWQLPRQSKAAAAAELIDRAAAEIVSRETLRIAK